MPSKRPRPYSGHISSSRQLRGLSAKSLLPQAPVQSYRQDRKLAGQRLGIEEVDEGIWLVSFMSYDLIDLEQKTLQPIDNPFGPRLSPMS